MIQVLKRSSDILELLSREKKTALKNLAVLTKLKKPTLFVILKSLIEIGFVEKTEDIKYKLGEKLFELTRSSREKNTILAIAEEIVENLAGEIKESVLVAKIYNGERCTIASAVYRQTVMVDTSILKKTSFYENATGRVLLAYLDDSELKKIVKMDGMPGDEWPEVHSYTELKQALSKIKSSKIAFKTTNDGDAQFLAVPVFGPDNNMQAAIGVSLPSIRFKGKHKKEVMDKLKAAGERMSHKISLF